MDSKSVGPQEAPLHLLFVDDNPLDYERVRGLLTGRVIELIEAGTGAAARAHAATNPPDCVLLDDGLLDADGLDLLGFFQAAKIPVVVLIGPDRQHLAAKAITNGASDYLLKDTLTGAALLKAVEGAIQKHDMLRLIARQRDLIRAHEEVLEALPVGICMIKSDGQIILTNRAASALIAPDGVGQSLSAQFEGRAFWCVDGLTPFSPEEMPAVRCLADAHPHAAEFEVRDGDSVITIGSSAAPILEPDGALRSVVVAYQDLSSFKALERQTHRAHRAEMISRLASGVAHDFNNLNAVIELNATMALDEVGPDDPVRDDLLGILDATRAASALTRRLVSFSKAAPEDPTDIPASPGIPAPPRDPRPPRDGGARILLAEDEPGIRKQLGRLLPRLGYQVESAADGAEALARLVAAPDTFDLLLTDIVMPGLQGPDLARHVLALRPSLPVIFMTGCADISAATLPGPLLRKPFIVPMLEETLREVFCASSAP